MNLQIEVVEVLYENSEQKSFHPFLFSCLRTFQYMLPCLKANQLFKDGLTLYKRSKVQRDSIASSQVAFHNGESDLME